MCKINPLFFLVEFPKIWLLIKKKYSRKKSKFLFLYSLLNWFLNWKKRGSWLQWHKLHVETWYWFLAHYSNIKNTWRVLKTFHHRCVNLLLCILHSQLLHWCWAPFKWFYVSVFAPFTRAENTWIFLSLCPFVPRFTPQVYTTALMLMNCLSIFRVNPPELRCSPLLADFKSHRRRFHACIHSSRAVIQLCRTVSACCVHQRWVVFLFFFF